MRIVAWSFGGFCLFSISGTFLNQADCIQTEKSVKFFKQLFNIYCFWTFGTLLFFFSFATWSAKSQRWKVTLFLSYTAFPLIPPRNSSNVTDMEKPFLSPQDESQGPSTAHRKDTSLLVLLKEISLSCSFQKRKIGKEHIGLLLEGILFPFFP